MFFISVLANLFSHRREHDVPVVVTQATAQADLGEIEATKTKLTIELHPLEKTRRTLCDQLENNKRVTSYIDYTSYGHVTVAIATPRQLGFRTGSDGDRISFESLIQRGVSLSLMPCIHPSTQNACRRRKFLEGFDRGVILFSCYAIEETGCCIIPVISKELAGYQVRYLDVGKTSPTVEIDDPIIFEVRT